MFVALAACGGINEKLETLRAERIEIVDDKGVAKLDVEKQLRALEERIERLETALARRQRESNAPPVASVTVVGAASASASAAASSPTVEAAQPRRPRTTPPKSEEPGY